MNPDLGSAIAEIQVATSRGTGGLVAPDLVLTALHVVADRKVMPPAFLQGEIRLTFRREEERGHVVEVASQAEVVEGCWSGHLDFVLLRCLTPPSPEHFRPLPLTESVADGEPWETFGFAIPGTGSTHAGTIRNANARTPDGDPAIQLLDEEKGLGEEARGFSGAPLLVGGAAAGLIRSGVGKGGTVWASPIESIRQELERLGHGDLLPVPDPYRGLPALPRQDLPSTPFRFLKHYTAREAEIFFGRAREVRQLYHEVTADGTRVVLFYGQSGAGKSSVLDAGLLPRLHATHTTKYLRRDRESGLLPQLLESLFSDGTGPGEATLPPSSAGPEALPIAWHRVEATTGRPLVLVLDQVEEVFTQRSQDPNEWSAFVEGLARLAQASPPPRGRLILGFRKEWLAEIEKALEGREVPRTKVFLDALDTTAVAQVVSGLRSTRRLLEVYRLEIEPGLADRIAQDLTSGHDSPVAPMLQVLLSRMWEKAVAESASRPAFTHDLYDLCSASAELSTFLEQQCASLHAAAESEREHLAAADVVLSGLADDLLYFHVDYGTAASRTADALRAAYPHRADVQWLVQEMKSRYLLSEPGGEALAASAQTRLSHDALAVPVTTRFHASNKPGQRARRILETRAAEWTGGREGPPLDAEDLRSVEQGLRGMRAPRPEEDRLLAASRAKRDTDAAARRRSRYRSWAAAALIVLLALIGVGVYIRGELQSSAAGLQTRQALAAADFREAQGRAAAGNMPAALAYLARSLRGDPNAVTPRAWAFDVLARFSAPLLDFRSLEMAVLSPDGAKVFVVQREGTAAIWDVRTRQLHQTQPSLSDHEISAAAFSPDGSSLVTGSRDGMLRSFDLRTGRQTDLQPHSEDVRLVLFSRGGARFLTASQGEAWVRDALSGKPVSPRLDADLDSLSPSSLSANGDLVVWRAGQDVIRLWDEMATSLGSADAGSIQTVAAGAIRVKPGDPAPMAAVSADGTKVLVTNGISAETWDPRRMQLVRSDRLDQTEALVPLRALFGPNGPRVILGTSYSGEEIGIWDTQMSPPFRLPLNSDGPLVFMDVNADGTRVAAVSSAGAGVWDAGTGDTIGTSVLNFGLNPETGPGFQAEIGAGGAMLLTMSPSDGVRVSDVRSGRPILEASPDVLSMGAATVCDSCGAAIAVNADTTFAVIAANDRKVGEIEPVMRGGAQLWDLRTRLAAGPPFYFDGRVEGAAVNGDSMRVIVEAADGTWHLLDSPSRQDTPLRTNTSGSLVAASFNANGTHLVTRSDDDAVQVWDSTGTVVAGPISLPGVVTASFGGERVVMGTGAGNLRVWDPRSDPRGGRVVSVPYRPDRDLVGAALSGDGTRVMVWLDTGAILIIDTRSGKPLRVGAEGEVVAGAFGRDRALVATASTSRLRVWDATTGRPVGEPDSSFSYTILLFSPDGTRIVAARPGPLFVFVREVQAGTATDYAALAGLAEIVGGLSLSPSEELEEVQDTRQRWEGLRGEGAAAEPGRPGAASFLRWFFQDPWERTISPLSSVTVPEYIKRLLTMGNEGRTRAERAFPGHPLLTQPK